MARESSQQILRQIRAIFVVGTTGGLTDADLIGRFLEGTAPEAEEAFAALVRRHGPMVLGVCRRMLAGSADVDDAFQAVFLVLARKAGAIRHAQGLRSWLHGVSIRTAKEARRRSLRRRVREGGLVDVGQVEASTDDTDREWLALLDEELNRLPARYREPLQLCELAGASRQEAARQLQLPEGTLSSRIARGRSLLRERLTRRGVSLGAIGLAAFPVRSAVASIPDSLAGRTIQHALDFTRRGGGVVPPAIASLAEGILTMGSFARLKLASAAAVVGVVGLSFAFAALPQSGKPDAPVVPRPVAVVSELSRTPEGEDRSKSPSIEVRGTIVDEAGLPVAGAEVLAQAFATRESRGTTAADGSFSVRVSQRQLDGLTLLVRSSDERRLGSFRYDFNLTRAMAEAQPRILLKPSRAVAVRVADANKIPVAGATVEAYGNFTIFARAKTGADGSATLKIPADAKVEWIYALKPIQGFDYAEFGPINAYGQSQGGVGATELPATVALTFEGTRTGQIKAVDGKGKPQPGVAFYPWLLQKPNRRSSLNIASPIIQATTEADGIARFDWLPLSVQPLTFWPVSEAYARHRVELTSDTKGPITVLLTRTEAIRGRVLHGDGSPAQGVKVYAIGSGNGRDTGQAQGRTSLDGSYQLDVSPGEVYYLYVDDPDWVAPTRYGIVVDEGKPVAGIDFRLSRGSTLRGTVTVGPARRPAPKQYLRLIEIGSQPFAGTINIVARTLPEGRRSIHATTDDSGRYSIRLAPGPYTLMWPPRIDMRTVTIEEDADLVHDFQMPRPEKGPLAGRVVLAADDEKGVAGAKVEFIPMRTDVIHFSATADNAGRFQIDRPLDRTVVCARSADGSHGAIVEIGPDDTELTIKVSPTASATGLLLDENGKPAANEPLAWGRRVYLDEERKLSTQGFTTAVKTDERGRFTLPALVVGQDYDISILRNNVYRQACRVSPKAPGPIDLGTVRAGSYRPDSRASAEEMSSFTKDAPGAGAVAPPIQATDLAGKPLKLADYKGRYVLLDFWATWCGPCLAEIPNLQAIHDAYGKDKRLAILSLSVDEKIDEPRKFQEKKGLPWAQGHIGGGVHGPTPHSYGIRAIPAFVLVGPDGKIVARGMRGAGIREEIAKRLGRSETRKNEQ